MSRAVQNDIIVDRNADWVKVLTVEDNNGDPVDIGTATFEGDIKVAHGKPVVASFAFTILDGGNNGQVSIQLTDTESLKLSAAQTYRYDIFMTFNSIRRRLLKGRLTCDGNITSD